jgi:hypothetical protein
MKIRIPREKFFEITEETLCRKEVIKERRNNDVEKLKCSCGGEMSHIKLKRHDCYACNKCKKIIIRHHEN